MNFMNKIIGPAIVAAIIGLSSFILATAYAQGQTETKIDMHIRSAEKDSAIIMKSIEDIRAFLLEGKCNE